MPKKQKNKQQDDFDSPWKNALEWYFPDFMAICFPIAHTEIDWSRGFEFLDKELQQVVRDAKLGRRYADKLAKVWLKNGQEQWVLAHVEVQGDQEANYGRRLYTYNYRLFDRYNRPVASFSVLVDAGKKWRPSKFGYKLLGTEVRFKFPMVKLLDYKMCWDELAANDNPFATVIMAQLKAQETQRNPQERYDAKFYLIRRLYERGYHRDDIVKLFHFIDWIMHLPEALEEGFWQELQVYEETKRMPYVTSVERIGIKKGLKEGHKEGHKEGLQEGRQEEALYLLLRLLSHRFGEIQDDLKLKLQRLTVEQVENLVDAGLAAPTLAEFVATLPPIENSTNDKSPVALADLSNEPNEY